MRKSWNFPKYVSLTKKIYWKHYFQFLIISSKSWFLVCELRYSHILVKDATNLHHFTGCILSTNFKFISYARVEIMGEGCPTLLYVYYSIKKVYARRINGIFHQKGPFKPPPSASVFYKGTFTEVVRCREGGTYSRVQVHC